MTQQINVDIDKLTNITCPSCRHKEFDITNQVLYLPALLSPNGRPGLIKIPVNVCRYCGSIYRDELLIENYKIATNGNTE